MPYLGTANVARDVDRIRRALGADRISLLGISYGTYLATAYDAMFPRRVDRMLLESNVDPARAWRGVWRDSLTGGLETRLPDFLDFAVAGQERYRLGSTPAEVRATVLDLIGRADLATPAGLITGTQLRIALFGAMYNDKAFPRLAGLLAAVRDGDARTAGELSTELQVWYDDNTASAQYGVFCADGTLPRSPEVYAREAAADATRFPLTGGASAAIWPCAYWASDPADPPVAASPRGRDNVLLINALRDPATTHAGAVDLRRAFGDRARLVSADHGGHGVYRAAGNACADRVGTDFLVTGRRPVDARVGSDLEVALDLLVPRWIAEAWPIEKPRYVGRDLTWPEWIALPGA